MNDKPYIPATVGELRSMSLSALEKLLECCQVMSDINARPKDYPGYEACCAEKAIWERRVQKVKWAIEERKEEECAQRWSDYADWTWPGW